MLRASFGRNLSTGAPYCRLVDESSLTCTRLLDIDDFIENLWKIHVQVKSEGYVQVCSPDVLQHVIKV